MPMVYSQPVSATALNVKLVAKAQLSMFPDSNLAMNELKSGHVIKDGVLAVSRTNDLV